jgi:FixJ family two-component response regulator
MNLSQSISPPWTPNVSRIVPTVFVVDDDLSVRESLQLLIRISGWQPETFASAQEFLYRPRAPSPSCLICDVNLPDLNGLELQQLIADRLEMPIIFISGHGSIPISVRAMKAGAVEFLTKPFGDEELLNAISLAIERSNAALRETARVRALQDRYESLSPREREVMTLVVAGKMNKQIAADLRISQITVKAHRRKVMEKTKADSLADLVRIASTLRIDVAEHGRRAPWIRNTEYPVAASAR